MSDFAWGGAEQATGSAIINAYHAGNDTTNCPKFSGIKPHALTPATIIPASATLKQAKITRPAYLSTVTVGMSDGTSKKFGPFHN
eukprot:TRINITY_DN123_c0_g1_i4.p1 TRINITY_DN123_c0_g1~~TRINITY_DN123_c0_g1_i4.p1  ORF type:complete len:100 (+),score=17.30 TRINITY_DN123_c0_g1_i4:47-301(+)